MQRYKVHFSTFVYRTKALVGWILRKGQIFTHSSIYYIQTSLYINEKQCTQPSPLRIGAGTFVADAGVLDNVCGPCTEVIQFSVDSDSDLSA